MNTLVLLLLTASVPGQSGTVIQSQPMPVIQSQSGPVIQSQSGPISSYDSDDSGWFSRFRNRQGLFPRVRGWFSRSNDQSPTTGTPISYPNGVPSTTSDRRLVPTPASNAVISSTPSITYGSSPYQYNPSSTSVAPQPLPR